MKTKINKKFIMISAIAVFITGICGMIIFYNIFTKEIFTDLKAHSYLIAITEPSQLDQQVTPNIQKHGIRITWIEPDGTVVYDSMQDEGLMENHWNREEIQAAMTQGEGTSVRKSATLSEMTYYYAVRLDNGNILRISKNSDSVFRLMIQSFLMMAVVCVGTLILCTIFARGLTRKLIEPVEKMAENIMLLDEREIYDEIKPFVTMIKQQHMDIMQHAKMRQEFSANVSHELKTPLTAISGYAELIASGMTSGEDSKTFASKIRNSAERLQHLINDIIEVSQLDDKEYLLEVEPVDLLEMAKDCALTMEFTADNHGVTIWAEGESAIINGNKELIQELFYNLCSNAIRYNKKGGTVCISTYVEDKHPVLCVQDTGIGIPDDQQERVFERFYRVDKSHSRMTGGTGLGLAIVKHIAARHDAQIVLSSELGVGTEIKVIF